MYHLFAGSNYYPQAGVGDYVNAFEELEDAEKFGIEKVQQSFYSDDWWIVLTEDEYGRLEEVASGRKERR